MVLRFAYNILTLDGTLWRFKYTILGRENNNGFSGESIVQFAKQGNVLRFRDNKM